MRQSLKGHQDSWWVHWGLRASLADNSKLIQVGIRKGMAAVLAASCSKQCDMHESTCERTTVNLVIEFRRCEKRHAHPLHLHCQFW